MTIKRRLLFGSAGGAGSPVGVTTCRSDWAFSFSVTVSATLLPSEIILQIGLSNAERAGQRELGRIVLIERADVLIICLLHRCLRLGDRKIIGYAGAEAFLCFR